MAKENLLKLTGLKLSGELSLLLQRGGLGPPFFSLCRALADRQVNICFLAHDAGFGRAMICVEPADAVPALNLARDVALDHGLEQPELIGQTAALTLFPLAQNPALPLIAAARLAQADIQPLAMATSLAAVVLLLAQRHAQKAVDVLSLAFQLPQGASPPEARVRVVQSPLRRPSE